MSSQRSMREILDLIWSRRLLVAGITLSALFGAILFSFFLPRKYESFTKVRVVDNKALYDIYGRRFAGAKDATDRIRSIHEELLSRKNIKELIETLNLDRDALGLPERELMEAEEALVRRIQSDTVVDLMETTPGQFIFRISHMSEDPALSQRIVTHLSTGYRNRQYEEQTEKAAQNLADVRAKIREAEEKLKLVTDELVDFEEVHSEHRFGLADDTPARLNAAREKEEEFQLRVETLTQQLKDFLAQLEQEPKFVEIVQSVGSPEKVLQLEKELREEQSRLDDLLQIYTDAHQAVIAQRARIARLDEDLEEARNEKHEVVQKVPNEIWARLQDSVLRVRSELKVKERSLEVSRSKVRELESLRQAWPELNTQWQTLVAKREHLRSQVRGLRNDEGSAEVTWSTKATESAIIFDVLDPPVYPLHPSSPNRTLIAMVGLVLGLGIGVGLVFVVDYFDHSFRYTEEVAAAFDVPVLGSIARIETLAEREQARRKRRFAAAAVLALLVVVGTAAFLQIRYDGMISSFIRETVSLVN